MRWFSLARRTARGRGSHNFVQGFTIIELIVVAAIITMIGSLIFIQVQQARQKQRDVEREREVKELQNALAIYVTNTRFYPVSDGPLTGADTASAALLNNGAIQAIPLDPFNSGNYRYVYYSEDGATYAITYWLETDSIPGKSAGEQTVGP